jgi:signal transduction histidine kinase/CheY-like chemotaxis protein
MRLNKRLAVLLFGSATTAVAIGVVAAYFLIMPRFFAFEERVVRGDVETAENALIQMLTGLHARARDWSTRPDVRALVRQSGPEPKLELPDPGLGALQMDYAAVLREAGGARWLRGEVAGESLERLHQRFLARECYSFWGVTRLSRGPVMFAIEPVGNGCNALFFAVALDAGVAAELKGITGLPVEFVSVDDGGRSTGRHIQVERLGSGRARGSFPVESYTGEVVLRGQVELVHPLYGRGMETLFWTALLLLVIALTVAAAVWWLLHRLVFRRLNRLHGTVRAIAQGGDLSRRVELGGRDELNELACDFNQMVTTLREARDELAVERENAESASRAKSLFLANISHEIRTPMTAVLGYTDLLRREDGLSEDHRRHLDIVQENGDALLALINDVLDLSRIEAGEIQVEHRCFGLPALFNEVIATHELRAREKGLALTLHYDTRVPDQVITDSLRLRQILINLVGNAVKFTDAGRVDVSVAWETGVQPFLHVMVRDTGIGIAGDTLEAVFQPFAQEDGSHTRRFGGSGLGLAIARELARSLGGDVEAESEPGAGSVFRVRIRAVGAEDSRLIWPDREPARPRPVYGETVTLSGTALVVEDNAVNRLFVKQVLEGAGMEVREAVQGEQALERIDTDGVPDLIVMDMQMPVMDGYETAHALRERGLDVPILALTANVMSDHRRECLEAGCDAFIGKPVRVRTLLNTCARLLRPELHSAAPGPER